MYTTPKHVWCMVVVAITSGCGGEPATRDVSPPDEYPLLPGKFASQPVREPLVALEAFASGGDFYISYEVNAYTRRARNMTGIYSELHGHIVDGFNEAGVEIMSPHYSAIRDGNPLTLPEDHLPKDYQPAPFRIFPLEGLFKKK